jgi:putative PIN family toxin of toxin-antitoxin system
LPDKLDPIRKLRVVPDTNCLVSAIVFSDSRLSKLRRHWLDESFVPLGCKETVNELIRVLAYPKFRLSVEDIEHLLADILPFLETCTVCDAYAAVKGLRDAQDAVFIHLAEQAGADMLVSGDADILELQGDFTGFRILAPADFMALLTKPA